MSPESDGSEAISHFAAIRVIVTGSGSLKMSIYSMDDIRSKQLVPFALKNVIRVVPTRLVNFLEQRALFEFKTTNMDEYFKITKIIVFTKEVYMSHPGA